VSKLEKSSAEFVMLKLIEFGCLSGESMEISQDPEEFILKDKVPMQQRA